MSDYYIMDVFGHLTRQPKRRRRTRCVVCNELTESSLSMSYWHAKTEKMVSGIHCPECAKRRNEEYDNEARRQAEEETTSED
jgi:hypothetical protein